VLEISGLPIATECFGDAGGDDQLVGELKVQGKKFNSINEFPVS
jgi:hypothetical protein